MTWVGAGRRCDASRSDALISCEFASLAVGDAVAAMTAMWAAEGAAATVSIAAADVVLTNVWRVEPTQYPQRTRSRLASMRVSDELARITSNLREYRNV